MSSQEKKEKDSSRTDAPVVEVQADRTLVDRGKQISEVADDLVQQIDDLLEQNAAEFVKRFVQRGGQ